MQLILDPAAISALELYGHPFSWADHVGIDLIFHCVYSIKVDRFEALSIITLLVMAYRHNIIKIFDDMR